MKIVSVFNKQTEIDGFSRMVPTSEIADTANAYNLNIPRYIDNSEPEDLHDLDAHLNGGIPYTNNEQAENDTLQTALETAEQAFEEYIEAHTGDEGLLSLVVNDSGNITKTSVNARIKELTPKMLRSPHWNTVETRPLPSNRE